ncbi:Starch-binding associating with outer membrane [Reichenbachiella agariperforans]|uniref:Starch-binding associating with outer membrane n=1 Tax=Reichenbachiella agariperforans TaxID=156994 RepID=A0A1M6LSL0_REIAG|nr:RagB/SusD family nutrient uptake outer membrane protein [Reichenbachiella agariperforans]SHJ74179.1 Starch-binding associating with outer membrane [Reichenbachiella agariperforans]
MKFNRYIIAGLMSLLALNACDQDKLELTNPNDLSPETFLVTQAQAQSAVNAVYANLQTRGLYSRGMFFSMDNMSHENSGNPQLEADKVQYLNFTFDPSHGLIRAYWESCYRGINKCNYVIDNEEKIRAIVSADFTDAMKDNFIGEAKFMRAYYYFLLGTRFGDIPLVITTPTSGEGTPKSPVSAVYDQIILDLTDAADKLFAAGDAENGRATSGAAYALMGKMELYRGNYGAAKTAFNNILGDYSLVADYTDNFLEETEFNAESIFEVSYDIAVGKSDQWNSDASGSGFIASTFRGQEYGWNDWYNAYPSDALVAEFETGDPRLSGNFYFNGDAFAGGTVSLPAYGDPAVQRTQAWRKYSNYYKDANENQESGINFRVIRYADVLLMMAEIENEVGTAADAIGYLNEVRDRVGMPNYGTAVMDAAGYPVGTKAQIFDAIVHERMVELAGEQVRFPDLVRWGLAEQELSAFGFEAGKHEVFPIPQQEINFNSSLSNDDQNFGY